MLESSPWGRRAIALDLTGTLAKLVEGHTSGTSTPESFEAASKAAEDWLNTVCLLERTPSVDAVYRMLIPPADDPKQPTNLLNSFAQHSDALRSAFVDLAALSDAPVKWEYGRGLSAIAGHPEHVFPHVWSSAHEAAHGIAKLALDLLVVPLVGIDDAEEQTSTAKQLVSSSWKALVIPLDEVASLQERIRRERAKLHVDVEQPANEWSEAKSPTDWQKELSISSSTWRRYIDRKKLVVDRITSKKVRIRLDKLHALTGSK